MEEILHIVRDPGRLRALGRSGLLDSPPEDRFDRYTRLGRDLLEASGSLVTLLDEDRQFFKSQVGLSEPWASLRETPLRLSFCKFTVARREPFVVRDAGSAEAEDLEPDPIVEELGIRSYAGVPLRPFGDQAIGSFAVFDEEPRQWSARELERVRVLGNAVEREIQEHLMEDGQAQAGPMVAYRELVEELPLGVLVHRSGQIEYANPECARILGLEATDELEGLQLLEFISPSQRDQVREQVRKVQEDREPVGIQRYSLVVPDGGRREVEALAVPVRWEDDDAVQVVVRDVTSRELSQRKYRLLFELSPVPVSLSTLSDGRFVEVNQAFAGFAGYEPEELIGASAPEMGLWVNPEDRDELVRRARREGMARGVEARVRRRSGEVREVELFGTALEIDGDEYLLAITHDLTDRNELERELEEVTLHDPLTGLANRILFRDRVVHALERAERDSTVVAVVYLDLDRFKMVNDSLGHRAGDRLLQELAGRLKACLRDEDSLARIGGDEFGVLVEGLERPGQVERVARRLTGAFDESFSILDTDVPVTASMGFALSGEGLDHAEDLMRFSDVAMFSAKEESGTSYSVFDPTEDTASMTRLHRENELRRAVERDEFEVHYQPVISLPDGDIVGGEALVRWAHPDRGVLPPSEFIGLAEETGLIIPMGELVLRQALAEASAWRWSDASGSAPWISVNVSTRQFQDSDFPERVLAILKASEVPPERLVMEITESVMMKAPGQIDRLRDAGVKVAVDDFGTGYSSLEYLRELELDVLKIDRSFVARIDGTRSGETLIRAMVMVAREWDLAVVGEGVEREEQRHRLEALGCTLAQGFFFGRAVPKEEFRELLSGSEERESG